jgi:hypothetical protein
LLRMRNISNSAGDMIGGASDVPSGMPFQSL